MGIVASIELDKHGVGSRREMAFHDFGNLLELTDHAFVHRTSLERDADVSTRVVAQRRGTHIVARTRDDTDVNESLYALMNGSTRDATFGGDVFERDACIAGDDFENLLVQTVDLFHKRNH